MCKTCSCGNGCAKQTLAQSIDVTPRPSLVFIAGEATPSEHQPTQEQLLDLPKDISRLLFLEPFLPDGSQINVRVDGEGSYIFRAQHPRQRLSVIPSDKYTLQNASYLPELVWEYTHVRDPATRFFVVHPN